MCAAVRVGSASSSLAFVRTPATTTSNGGVDAATRSLPSAPSDHQRVKRRDAPSVRPPMPARYPIGIEPDDPLVVPGTPGGCALVAASLRGGRHPPALRAARSAISCSSSVRTRPGAASNSASSWRSSLRSRAAVAHQLPGAHARRVQLEDAVRPQVHHHAAVTEPIGHGVRAVAENRVGRPCSITVASAQSLNVRCRCGQVNAAWPHACGRFALFVPPLIQFASDPRRAARPAPFGGKICPASCPSDSGSTWMASSPT